MQLTEIKIENMIYEIRGVAMLATVLKSSIATQVSISIMDAFVTMRHYLSNNLLEQNYINHMVLEHDNEIKLLKETRIILKKKTIIYFLKDKYMMNIHY